MLLIFFGPLAARWHEPVLRHPVLIIESDDWGAGPLAQAEVLLHLSTLLKQVRDCSNRSAVMTLGIVLEVPDGLRIVATGNTLYHALPLTDTRYDAVRFAIKNGIEAGVFVPQLHGQCPRRLCRRRPQPRRLPGRPRHDGRPRRRRRRHPLARD